VFDTLLWICVVFLLLEHLIALWLLVRNLRWLYWPPGARPKCTSTPSVSVIVPARNEEEDIEKCLRSLLAQNYPDIKIIAINDHSADDTPRIIDRIAAEDPRLIAIHNPSVAPGWLGKQNAMQAALAHVDSELLVLTDADVKFDPNCISSAIAELQTRQLDFLSIYPQFEFVTFCETMLLPIYVGGTAMLLSPAIENPRSQRALAVGAFILLRTELLQQIGGFESIRDAILDDVTLAQRFKKHGFKISLRWAPDLMHVRFFKNNRHAFFGAAKHMLGTLQSCIWLAPIVALHPLLMYGILLFALVYGILEQRLILAGISLLTLSIHYGSLLLTRPNNKFNALLALAFPWSSIQFAVSGLWATYQLLVRGKFHWRGRSVDLKAGSAPERMP